MREDFAKLRAALDDLRRALVLCLLPARDARPMDVIEVNGRLHAVRAIERSANTNGYLTTYIEPLGDMLARNILVGDVTLADALIDAGWTPPG